MQVSSPGLGVAHVRPAPVQRVLAAQAQVIPGPVQLAGIGMQV